MFDRLIHFSIQNRLVISLFTVLLISVGVYAVSQISIDAVPDITNNQVQIVTKSPSFSAQEVEQFITAPLEILLSNLQGMHEIRSISRSGLSVITIVFDENIDIYRARQLVSEQIKAADIPATMGMPELMPITTGLGEVYQYIIAPKKGYEKKFSSTDLRTLQDWIVRRQLAGVEGVVEISSFGGKVKQYEVALFPERLRAQQLSIAEVLNAIEKNNNNAGSGYIEKSGNRFFIRGEGMVTDLSDIARIIIKHNTLGQPILIGDVAEVRLGEANRFGAMSSDGKGEVVGGIVLMLKGANAVKVTNNIKERIAKIANNLPEGVEIVPYLDRSDLVNRAIKTVETNLMEGGLIVIAVLVIFLGNLRAGLVVASVIPLSLLFAITMMYLTGVSANLMSLGAIDFGLVVDGAVIMVEAILHRLQIQKVALNITQQRQEVLAAATEIRKSASFGELIIMIVYLPILTLSGIEGKMFVPMAQTVSYAILGALLLSLTYVPMMSAWVLVGGRLHQKNFADKIVEWLSKRYTPILMWALRVKYAILGVVLITLVGSLVLFGYLGGEFIPELEEGDFAVETRLMTGTSLEQTLATSQLAEKILLRFPEVKKVVSKIGSSEVPTDPMPVEANDLIVVLNDKSTWTTAHDREALADTMQKALQKIVGVNFEFQQPIQMRFNELMTGVKSDIAIKIYGEDMQILLQEAKKVAQEAQKVKGVSNIKIEQVAGLPQMVVRYDRQRLAQYGLTVEQANQILQTAFAGAVAGVVFEGEKRFDLVVRLDKDYRKDLNDIRELYIPLPSGEQIPLVALADINYEQVPAQISRDNAKRRITIGLNVNGRDMESVVLDIQERVDKNIKLPPGYSYTFGGQFENLVNARNRLMIAVPVALGIILIMLYFTFQSLSQTLLIFTAIPLASIGGIWALWFRGMPFSISAGIGFIALFGVAVLNGIVLISYFNQLEKEGIRKVYVRIWRGTHTRFRPVLMTATVASVGFLPMALSHGAGAEVQKPLATVVIGGLFTATLLTLIILPILYSMSYQKFSFSIKMKKSIIIAFAFFLLTTNFMQAQNIPLLNENQVINQVLENNKELEQQKTKIEMVQKAEKTAFNLPKTDFTWEYGNVNNSNIDYRWQVWQGFMLPAVYRKQYQLNQQLTAESQAELSLKEKNLIREARLNYQHLVFLHHQQQLYQQQTNLLEQVAKAANTRYSTGETDAMEAMHAQAQYKLVQNQYQALQYTITQEYQKLARLMQIGATNFKVADSLLIKREAYNTIDINTMQHPTMALLEAQKTLQQTQIAVEKTKLLPEFRVGYYNMQESNNPNLHAVQAGVSIPIWAKANKTQIQSQKIGLQWAEQQIAYNQQYIETEIQILQQEQQRLQQSLNYFEQEALPQARLLAQKAEKSYRAGETDYFIFAQNQLLVFQIEQNYLQDLWAYNQTLIQLEYWQE
ncbi:MAG: CusA/CzcA family heavy metal efflux RND transporter [Cytophagales bacterium]|nr:MAG: CusA/CzcA family heavy metal efflux RND transporter [Cytophagales bacterium]